jgi:alkyldihydroxyacetonephosphate synthase
MIRFLDDEDLSLSLHLREKGSLLHTAMDKLKDVYLKRILKYTQPTLLLLGFEGKADDVVRKRKQSLKVCENHKGYSAGSSFGAKWRKNRFLFPLIRDFMMDRGVLTDVAETATLWDNVVPLHHKVRADILSAMESYGQPGWAGCHISHTYHTGACLYFTFACMAIPGKEFEQYNTIKSAATNAIMKYNGALSHHHSVGYEHQSWLEEEIGPVGMETLSGIKRTLDPDGIINPGKLMEKESGDFDPIKHLTS